MYIKVSFYIETLQSLVDTVMQHTLDLYAVCRSLFKQFPTSLPTYLPTYISYTITSVATLTENE